MAGYKMVKYCGLCKKRFILQKGDKMRYYCKDCMKKFRKEEK